MSLSTSAENWEKRNLRDFYTKTNIFITGATGFLGKVLLEKLLRSCKDIGNIYLLIKPKKAVDPERRLQLLLECPIFNTLRETAPRFSEKVKVLAGDVAQQNLGLSDADRRLIIEEVNIVFHLAATVRFNGGFKETIMSNVFATKETVKLCEEVDHLKSFVYVSTAFSNADKERIEEVVYEPPYEPRSIISLVQTLPSHILDKIVPELLGKHPNVYTFSKALAESIVSEHSTRFPAAIVRPSIVSSSWKEPFPGWVDSFGGATGFISQCALGVVDDYHVGKNICAELIPVDVVVNTTIAAAWHCTARKSPTAVYNCVSGPINRITWKEFGEVMMKWFREYPTQYLIRYPRYIVRENKAVFLFHYLVFRYTVALMYDVFLYCTNRKPMVMHHHRKTAERLELVQTATFRERTYDVNAFRHLMEAVENSKDRDDFGVDMSKGSGFDWDDYLKAYSLGIRRHIFKDDSSPILARAKL